MESRGVSQISENQGAIEPRYSPPQGMKMLEWAGRSGEILTGGATEVKPCTPVVLSVLCCAERNQGQGLTATLAVLGGWKLVKE